MTETQKPQLNPKPITSSIPRGFIKGYKDILKAAIQKDSKATPYPYTYKTLAANLQKTIRYTYKLTLINKTLTAPAPEAKLNPP